MYLLRKEYNLLWTILSNILLTFESKDIALQLETKRGSPLFLEVGITLANFNCVGYIPVENDRLMISCKGCHKLFLINFNTSVGMLFGPDVLLLSKESIINTIS